MQFCKTSDTFVTDTFLTTQFTVLSLNSNILPRHVFSCWCGYKFLYLCKQ